LQRNLTYQLRCQLTILLRLLLLASFALFAQNAKALVLTSYFESILVPNVSTAWTTVTLDNNYANAIPVCTYVLGTFAGTNPNYTNPPAVVRIRNIGSSSFQIRIQGWEDTSASAGDVHCMVMDEGAHTLPDGRLVEAHSVLSDLTNGQFATDGGWSLALMEDVSASIVHNYTAPVVQASVMSYNDNRASVPFITDCDSRQNHPFMTGMADGICVGKHIGQIADSRAPETIGYIIGETGIGTINNVFYELALGVDSVAGNNAGNTGGTYNVTRDHTMAVLTQAGEDGGNGSYAVLYSNDPLPANDINLAVDEDTFTGDTTRNHTNEPVYYWAFAGAEITLIKNLINDDGGTATIADFVLSATGTDSISGVSGTSTVTKAVVTPGTYTLAETTMPGYTTGAWACTGAASATGTTIDVVGGDHAICTITNDDNPFATLTLEKQLVNDNGGTAVVSDFTLSFSGPGSSGSGVMGDAAVTNVTVPAGSYTLTENSLNGYSLDGIRCNGSDSDAVDGLDIVAGEKITCVFVNNDQAVDLSIQKSVNDDSPNIGDTLTFTLLIENSGPNTATELHVVDSVPAGFSYIASSMTGGDVQDDSSPEGTGLDWTINTLPSGSSVSLTFQATVLAP